MYSLSFLPLVIQYLLVALKNDISNSIHQDDLLPLLTSLLAAGVATLPPAARPTLLAAIRHPCIRRRLAARLLIDAGLTVCLLCRFIKIVVAHYLILYVLFLDTFCAKIMN